MKNRNVQMKKGMCTALLVLLLSAVGATKGYAQTITVDNLNYTVIHDGSNSVTLRGHVDGQGAAGTLTIPSTVTYDGTTYTVTGIDEGAFSGCLGLTGDLIIPNSVTWIGSWAFAGCEGFNGSLILGNSLTSIGYEAFQGCIGFTGNLTIPNSVTIIGSRAFEGCSGFTGNLTIPNSVTIIGSRAFRECSGFNGELILPNSLTEIGGGAFYGCSGFIGELNIPNSVSIIQDGDWEDGTFGNCSGFTSLVLSNSLTRIASNAFYNCTGFSGTLNIPNSVVEIGRDAFACCSGFTGTLVLPNSLNYIGSEAFVYCTGLTGNLVIPNSVNEIGSYAFAECSGLNGNLLIPQSISFISEGLFYHCYGFTSITVCNDTTPTVSDLGQYYAFEGIDKSIPVYVPIGSIPAYQTAYGWIEFTNYIESTGIDEQKDITVSAYPNPTIGNLTIEAIDLKQITITNMLGQVIYEGKANGNVFEYDFGRHDEGTYLIRIETVNGEAVKKVSVTR